MREWLTAALLGSAEDLPEDFEGYVLGRGLPSVLVEEMRIGVWRPPETSAPDEGFTKQHGRRGLGEWREGWMTVPLWSPRGRLVGVEFRKWDGVKEIQEFRLPDAKWNPVFIGLTPSALQKIWTGGNVWLVEGVFDIALAHVIPETDVALGCGTARITKNQINFLVRFLSPSAMVYVAFDEDETGRKQSLGSTDEKTGRWVSGVPQRLEKVGVRARSIRYRGGKDPGEIWEKGGRSALVSAFNL